MKLLDLGLYHSFFGGRLIDLKADGTQDTCSVLPGFPGYLSPSAVAVYDSRPFVCAGLPTPKCQHYSSIFKRWMPYGQMLVQRDRSASVDLGGGKLWITGGSRLGVAQSSTEIFKGGVSSPGPDLPVACSGHCLVNLDDDRVFMVCEEKAFLYHRDTGLWTRLPDLRAPRFNMGCSTMGVDNKSKVLVHGGSSEDGEIFDLGTNEWLPGPENESKFFSLTYRTWLVPYGETVLLIQGGDDEKTRTEVKRYDPKSNRFEAFVTAGKVLGANVVVLAREAEIDCGDGRGLSEEEIQLAEMDARLS